MLLSGIDQIIRMGEKIMGKSFSRFVLAAVVLAMMLSLAGCILTIDVTGSEIYDVTSAGVTDGPIKVDIVLKGFLPTWPNYLVATIGGNVNPGLPIVGDEVEANRIQAVLYDKLYNGGVNDFDEIVQDATLTDDYFSVTVKMAVPPLSELLHLSQAGPAMAFNGVDLSMLLGQKNYQKIVDGLVNACKEINEGYMVRTEMEGELTKGGEGGKHVGSLDITFDLNGSKLPD